MFKKKALVSVIYLTIFVLSLTFLSSGRTLPFFSPLPQKVTAFDKVTALLKKRPNSYSLKKSVSLIQPVSAGSQALSASAFVLTDFDTGEVIADKNMSQKVPIASITKVMTAVVALDLLPADHLVTLTKNASRQIPTKIGMVPGHKMTLEELLHATLLTSANDAAYAIKDGADAYFRDKVFVRAMNEKARFLGLKNTHFENPAGFDAEDNFSTAEDVAILSYYALKNYPLIAEIVQKDYAFLPKNQYHKQYDLYNWNGLIGVYPGVAGVKIGNTEGAGKTTVVLAQRTGKTVMAVLLGAPGVLERDIWTAELLDYGFEKLADLQSISLTEKQLKEKYATWQYWH